MLRKSKLKLVDVNGKYCNDNIFKSPIFYLIRDSEAEIWQGGKHSHTWWFMYANNIKSVDSSVQQTESKYLYSITLKGYQNEFQVIFANQIEKHIF